MLRCHRGRFRGWQDAVKLELVATHNDLVEQRPQQRLAALERQSVEAPEDLGALALDRFVLRLLGAPAGDDFLGTRQALTKRRTSRAELLRVAMAESLVGPFKRDIIWRAVRDFGDAAWTANARAKADGQSRIIPPSALPIPVLVTWPEYRTQLFTKGIRAEQSTPASPPEYCTAAPLVKLEGTD
jgi:hypothetical protein